ncbi:Ig-like domain-containing protein [Myxococcus stipitatus]|uniref:Ig-like domain-containing protein n=1 Tax=Myxococcus stipitatus TaxID=83455 RepID=UPI001F30DAEA|nr:Ig-like domain-containing protein [Myxococcus stipitatus]MCE9669014.1 Ig-like domain-containing protein [Myxococcus stipitatus]
MAARLVTSTRFTNGKLNISVELSGPVPDTVELLVDGAPVLTLLPPYRIRWDTQELDEGERELLVRLTLGSRVTVSDPVWLTVDRTPPKWVSGKPAPADQLVPVSQVVQAVFSEPLDPASVTADSIKLVAGTEVIPTDAELSARGTEVNLRPRTKLPVETLVEVAIGQVADRAGNPIQPLESTWSWFVPGFLPLGEPLTAGSPASARADYLQIQTDSAGNPWVVWVDSETKSAHVRRWNGMSWEQVGTTLESGVEDSLLSVLSMRLDSEGFPVIAWVEQRDRSIRVHRWTGTQWQKMGSPFALPVWLPYPILRTDGHGQWFLAFTDGYDAGSRAYVWKWLGDRWDLLGSDFKVDPTKSLSGMGLEIDTTGMPVVAWTERDASINDTTYMSRWSEGQWRQITNPMAGLLKPYGFDGQGRLILSTLAVDGKGACPQIWARDGAEWNVMGAPIPGLFSGETIARVKGFFVTEGTVAVVIEEPEAPGLRNSFFASEFREGVWRPRGGILRPTPGTYAYDASFVMSQSGRLYFARIEPSGPPPEAARPIRVYAPND